MTVETPPRYQDQIMVVCTTTADGRRHFAVQSTRVHVADANGMPLAQPIPEPLDEFTAFDEIMEACQSHLTRLIAEKNKAATSAILTP